MNPEIISLASAIYAERISHLGSSEWDFAPHAKIAIDAAKVFFDVAQARFSEAQVPPSQPSPVPQEQHQTQTGAETGSQLPQYPGLPEIPLPPNQP